MQTSPMTTTSPWDKLADSLLGRLALALLSGVIAALTIPFLFLANSIFQPVVLRWTALAWLGLAAGLAVRGLLRRYPVLLQILSAAMTLFFCLGLSGALTYGYIGFRPIFRTNLALDWMSILQNLFSGAIACLALFAQRKPRVKVAPVKPPASSEPLTLPGERVSERGKQPKPAPRKKRVTDTQLASSSASSIISWHPELKQLTRRFRKWQRQANQTVSYSRIKAGRFLERSRQVLRLRFNPPSRKVSFSSVRLRVPVKPAAQPVIHLVGAEEHRCPYCLELVEPNDPRGIMICPVCHTYHHADCWAVTGVCQVPHHHE